MKNLKLILISFVIIGLSCTKTTQISTTPDSQPVKQTKRSTLEDIDNLSYKKEIKINDLNSDNYIVAVISANSQFLLDEYLAKNVINYKITNGRIQVSSEINNSNMNHDFQDEPKDNDIHIVLFDNDFNDNYEIVKKKTRAEGIGFAVSEYYYSNKNGASVTWLFTNNANSDIAWSFRWKNCAICSYSDPGIYTIANASNPWASYWVSSNKIRVGIHSNWLNYSGPIFWQ